MSVSLKSPGVRYLVGQGQQLYLLSLDLRLMWAANKGECDSDKCQEGSTLRLSLWNMKQVVAGHRKKEILESTLRTLQQMLISTGRKNFVEKFWSNR